MVQGAVRLVGSGSRSREATATRRLSRERKREVVVTHLSLFSRRSDRHRLRHRRPRERCPDALTSAMRLNATPREMRSTIARRCSIPVENATGNSRDESGLPLLAMQINEKRRGRGRNLANERPDETRTDRARRGPMPSARDETVVNLAGRRARRREKEHATGELFIVVVTSPRDFA